MLKWYIFKIHTKSGGDVSINDKSASSQRGLSKLQAADAEGWSRASDIYGDVTYVKVQAGLARTISLAASVGAVK